MLNKEQSEKSLIDDLNSWNDEMQDRALCRLARAMGDKAHRRVLQALEDSFIYGKGYYLESEDENS